MRKRILISVSVDIEIKELIWEESRVTRVSKSAIVNDILQDHYKEELNEEYHKKADEELTKNK